MKRGELGWRTHSQLPRGQRNTGHVQNAGGCSLALQEGSSPAGRCLPDRGCSAWSPSAALLLLLTLRYPMNLMLNFCCLSPNPERSLRRAWSTAGSVCSSPSQEQGLHCDSVVCLLGLFGIFFFLRKDDAFGLELRNRCASERFAPDRSH